MTNWTRSWKAFTVKRWVGDSGSTNNELHVGSHSLHLCWLDINHHGERYDDDSLCGYSYKTIKGWKLEHFPLTRFSAGISYRIILYEPVGSWWHFDIYVTFSRRYRTNKDLLRAIWRWPHEA